MNIDLRLGDCLELIKQIPDKSVDLIVTDPPYIVRTAGGGKNELTLRAKKLCNELLHASLTDGFDSKLYTEMTRVCKPFNAYIWCSKLQLPILLEHFAKKMDFTFDVLVWRKENPTPIYNLHYLPDKEYCLYFRERGGYCKPVSYELAKTIFNQPINKKDKDRFNHPTIKPLEIIETLILNSSREGETILDPFMGSGTTGVACARHNRNFIGMEINEKYFGIAKQRISNEQNQLKLF